jgi:hypothetical protein
MEEKLQALIGTTKKALTELVPELPFISISHNIIDDSFEVLLANYQDLKRIEGKMTLEQKDRSWRVSKVCNGISFVVFVDAAEVAEFVKY